MVDGHAKHRAVPFDHGVQIGREQAVMRQFCLDNYFGVHMNSPLDGLYLQCSGMR